MQKTPPSRAFPRQPHPLCLRRAASRTARIPVRRATPPARHLAAGHVHSPPRIPLGLPCKYFRQPRLRTFPAASGFPTAPAGFRRFGARKIFRTPPQNNYFSDSETFRTPLWSPMSPGTGLSAPDVSQKNTKKIMKNEKICEKSPFTSCQTPNLPIQSLSSCRGSSVGRAGD